MAFKFTSGCSIYGAQMGRRNETGDGISPVRLHLEHVRMYDGDYDKGGAYWGGGIGPLPLWVAYGEDPQAQIQIFVRAPNRAEAKAEVIKARANAVFYR